MTKPGSTASRAASSSTGDRSAPLTLGTAGHIDHGKTALVRRLTGVETDRLPEERARGISIALGYARLELPSGRGLSVVDVPGHERFVRTMVSGATGIDLFVMVVAADDGVMPQTREHAEVLRALAVRDGVAAITKADLADPGRAVAEVQELLPGVPTVACSSRTGEGLDALLAELDAVAGSLPGRVGAGGPPVLHVDRVFSVRGAGTVVTGTLWSGAVARGDTLVVRPGDRRARIRAVHVHDEPVERAAAGQRVALNLTGVAASEVARGDIVTDPTAGPSPTHRIDAHLTLDQTPPPRVHVHHGARDAPGRLIPLGADLWQARLERPLLAAPGDRVVVRSIAPADTLGGGVIVDAAPRRHSAATAQRERLAVADTATGDAREHRPASSEATATREPGNHPPGSSGADLVTSPNAREDAAGRPATGALSPAALALEQRLLAAGHEPPHAAELGDCAHELAALRDAGRAVRVGRSMYAHPDALAAVAARATEIIAAEGAITIARLRDELHTSRKYAQALLEHLDAARTTLRLPDDRRVLRTRGQAGR